MSKKNGKITSEQVKQACGCQKLEAIKSLSLSNCGIDELDVEVLKQLKTLKVLDLSANDLTRFPDMSLKCLDTLDLSDNNLTSVDFVKNLTNLKALYLQGNADLGFAERLSAVMLCSSLKRLDDCAVNVYHNQIERIKNKFEIQMKALFEVLFAEKFSKALSDEEVEKITEEFQVKLKEDPLFSSATSESEILILHQLSLEMIQEARSGRMFTNTNSTPGTPRSARISERMQKNSSGSTPRTSTSRNSRRLTSGLLDTPTNRPSTPANGRTPQKDSTSNTPNLKKRKRGDSPSSGSKSAELQTKRGRICSPVRPSYSSVQKEYGKLPMVQDYDPVFFIRCHSENNSPADETTKVWKCAMEPRIDKSGYDTNMVATCGGQIVCLIDCKTGKVMKRYKDTNENESFYTLAWTTITLNTERQEKTNILAVAGQCADIKLIHPSQFVMYATLEGHRNYISCLVFHPSKPTYLFSGSSDGKIILWDIGIPDVGDYSVNFQKLSVLQAPGTDALNLVINLPSNVLIAGCESSCYGWSIQNIDKISREHDFEFLLPSLSEDDDASDCTTVDGLVQLQNGFIVSKCVGEDVMCVWNVEENLSMARSSKQKFSHFISVKPSAVLQYSKSEVTYINIGATGSMVAVGDDKGKVHLYNLENVTKKKGKHSDLVMESSRVLEWPELNVDKSMERGKLEDKTELIINSTCLNQSKEFLICGTDNNLVCVWKRSTTL